jgi:hypothetical protein
MDLTKSSSGELSAEKGICQMGAKTAEYGPEGTSIEESGIIEMKETCG